MDHVTTTTLIEFRGETKPIKEWAEVTGISVNNIVLRLRRGKTIEDALTTPVKPRNVYKDVNGQKIKVKKTELEKRMTDTERDKFLECFTTENFGRQAQRNKGICLFLLHTGLRLNELCELKVTDVRNATDFKETLDVRAETAKRGKNRQIPLSDMAHRALALLFEEMPNLTWDDKIIKVSPRQVREIIAQASIRAGLNRILSPHCLRHDFLSRVYAKSKDAKVCQRLAGHSSIKTTMDIYVQSTWTDLQEAVEDI